MGKFYSPSANAFYDSDVHGPRVLEEVDEVARDAALAELTKEEFAGEDEIEAESLDKLVESGRDRETRAAGIAARRTALLLYPPTRLVPNPDCRLPEDATPISDALHAELLAAQGEGKRIVANKGGEPIAIDPERTAEEVLAAARAQRDKALKASDYTQLPDALTAAKRKLWAEHRRQLRDLPGRIQEAIIKGRSPEEALALVQDNIAASHPDAPQPKEDKK